MKLNKISELERAGFFYSSIIAIENGLRRQRSVGWRLYILKQLAMFNGYTISEKLHYLLRGADKKNIFREFVYRSRYSKTREYYDTWLKKSMIASTKKNPTSEEIRCLFSVLNEVTYNDYYKIDDLIKPKDYIIDVGANVGAFSVVVKEKFPKTKILSFEPSFDTFTTLKANTEEYKEITIVNEGVGEKNEINEIEISSNILLNKMKDSTEFTMSVDPIRTEKVKVRKLDDYMEFEASIIKMDIEGYEEPALIGATKYIRKYQPLIICAVEHSKAQKRNLITRMQQISKQYSIVDLNDDIVCFYIKAKHKERIERLNRNEDNKK